MRFTHLFVPEAVGLRLKSRDYKAAIGELLGALKEAGRVTDETRARKDVLTRESQGSTYVGEGIAIPHAATPAVNQPLIAYGYSERGLRYSREAGVAVHHVFLILGTPASGPLHLRILARLAGVLDSFDFLQGLEHCQTDREVMALIQSRADTLDELVVPEEMPRIAVVYSSASDLALAAHASILGCRVRVLGREERDVRILASMGGINAQGEVQGFARLESASANPDLELEGADIIALGPPAHRFTGWAEWLAGHIREGQTIVLLPGRVGGALSVYARMRAQLPESHVYVCESQTALYECDLPSPALVNIRRINSQIPVSAMPTYALPEVLGLLNSALPYFVSGGDVLQTGLDNVTTFMLPTLALLNAARVEERESHFRLFREGVSPSVARTLEALDHERLQVAGALGVEIASFKDWLIRHHHAHGDDLHQALRSTRAYANQESPHALDDAAVVECVTHGLVPLASLGAMTGVPTPTAEALVTLASTMLDRDLLAVGCTARSMGLADLSLESIRQMLRKSGEFTNGQ